MIHFRRSTSARLGAVALLLSLAACAQSLPPLCLPLGVPTPTPPASRVDWEVLGRFRLLKDPDDSDRLFRRYKYYYFTGRRQSPDDVPLDTWWDPKTHAFDPNYLVATSSMTWHVRLTAPFGDGSCRWTIGGADQGTQPCRGYEPDLPFTGADTPVEAVELAGTGRRATAIVHPRDVLIATVGDSYASGEGTPDVVSFHYERSQWLDRNCHRSLYSGHSLAALMYAQINRHVSVTYLSLACSGASIITGSESADDDGGLLTNYAGVMPDGHDNPPQLTQLHDLLATAHRSPDYLTMSAAGNDLGFADIVSAAVSASLFGECTLKSTIQGRFNRNVGPVAGGMLLLKDAVQWAVGPNMGAHILVTGYPDPTDVSNDGRTVDCGLPNMNQIAFLGGGRKVNVTITAQSIKIVKGEVLEPLGLISQHLATELGATLIHLSGEKADATWSFTDHGFCAPLLGGGVTASASVRWINTIPDSERVMGVYFPEDWPEWPIPMCGECKLGAMHPNIRGQSAIGRALLENIRQMECQENKIPLTDDYREFLCGNDNEWRRDLPGYETVRPGDEKDSDRYRFIQEDKKPSEAPGGPDATCPPPPTGANRGP